MTSSILAEHHDEETTSNEEGSGGFASAGHNINDVKVSRRT
jgi:hypothetical protein